MTMPANAEVAETARFADVSTERLRAMLEAGRRVEECERVLANTGENVVSEVLKGQGTFYEWEHYPKGDVFDHQSHSQYYYHAHPKEERPDEHGHFHTFMRPAGMPSGVLPALVPHFCPPGDPNEAVSHLIAISMDRAGRPVKLFTTNRWVTAETWYLADDVIAMLDNFRIDHARPSWPTNLWITSLLRLFRPEIGELVRQRDQLLARHAVRHPERDLFEDREIEVLSEIQIDVTEQIAAIRSELAARRG